MFSLSKLAICLCFCKSGHAFLSIMRQHQPFTCGSSDIQKYGIRGGSLRCLSHRSSTNSCPVKNVAIIGGGLAGLSTAFHLLDIAGKNRTKFPTGIQITVFDKTLVGEGGASSVAGGLMHPFSPRGKLIHFGLTALDHSNHLIQTAAKNEPQCIVRPRLYRIALKTNSDVQLQHTADKYPTLARWMTKEDVHAKFDIDSSGGLELGGGCKVIHVPTYLKGLWKECEIKASALSGNVEWKLIQPKNDNHHYKQQQQQHQNVQNPSLNMWNDMDVMNKHLDPFDAVILSAGAGILHDKLLSDGVNLPAQLVRGQSIEMVLPLAHDSNKQHEAFLCGKYVSPLPSNVVDGLSQRYVIGATHEFKADALSAEEVREELKHQTYEIARHLWENGTDANLTTGVRLQSRRGTLGRMPMIGRYRCTDNGGIKHQNLWMFTGLSSRGLIYHGLFGKWLAKAVLHDNEEELRDEFDGFDWWKTALHEENPICD